MKGSIKIENVSSIKDILKHIEDRRPYVDKYCVEFGYKPRWEYKNEEHDKVNFETWYIAEKRNDKLNQLGI